MMHISAVIITRNEENGIARALASLDFCDEIVVVDSGSTDATVPICEKHHCRVFTRAFDGYGRQKQFAVSQAINDWVLSLDADEVVTPGLRQEIAALKSAGSFPVQGYRIPRTLVFLDRPLRFGGEYKKPIVRLFNRRSAAFTNDPVHEQVIVTGATESLENQILHYSYTDLNDYFRKFNDYTTKAAETLHAKKRKHAALNAVVRFPLTFIKIYLIKGCIFDGYAGFIWSLLSSMYPVVKYAKACEMQRSLPRRNP
jgi:glycosyltransferase involved in cell wall biosynthesis